MANLNNVKLIGNITRDPEVRYTPKGSAVADFSLAINRVWKDDSGNKNEETTYVDCVAWAKKAELIGQYVHKGDPLFVDGRLQQDTWEDKATGQKRSKLRVVVDDMQFLSSKREGEGRKATSLDDDDIAF